jgi:hypothetical protein
VSRRGRPYTLFVRPYLAPTPVGEISPAHAPSFSVVIRAYQSSATIGQAIESALTQTAPPLEVVVCDDGSTDDLDATLSPYRDRIRYRRQPNGGGASALNMGAQAATGDFVAILDADDAYLPERLEVLGELAAARPDLDILTTDSYLEVDGRRVGRFMPRGRFPVRDQRTAILHRCFPGGWPAVRRSSLLAVGGWDESLEIAHDWDCWLRLIYSGSSAGLVPEPLHVYRRHAGGLTARRADSLRERVILLEKAAERPDLSCDERAQLDRSLRHHRLRATLAEVETGVLAGSPGNRRRAVSLALGRGIPVGTRGKILVAAAAPAVARRILERRRVEEGSVEKPVVHGG